MGKRKKKNDSNIYLILTIIFVIITIILLIISSTKQKNSSVISEELKKEGYVTEKEDIFYKKIVTNNSLNSYYKNIAKKQNDEYEEYYVEKDTYNFIELKMDYKDEISTTLNINSNLKDDNINFNYEMSYNKTHILLEGNYNDNYVCKTILKENVKEETINNLCDSIIEEINVYKSRKDNILTNEKVQNELK